MQIICLDFMLRDFLYGGIFWTDFNLNPSEMIKLFNDFIYLSMEYDCHIFPKYLVFQMKNLVFQSKY